MIECLGSCSYAICFFATIANGMVIKFSKSYAILPANGALFPYGGFLQTYFFTLYKNIVHILKI